MWSAYIFQGIIFILTVLTTSGIIYDRCSLASQLRRWEGFPAFPEATLSNWLCIADKLTGFNTSYYAEIGEMKYFGIFFIGNDWCKDGDVSLNPCADCSRMLDDFYDTAECAMEIFYDNSGSGDFDYWSPEDLCEDEELPEYLVGCPRYTVFTSTGGEINITEGNTTTIACSAKNGGYTPLNLSWSWEHEGNDDHISFEFDPVPNDIEYFAYLTFETVLPTDSKHYTCLVDTSSGGESQTNTPTRLIEVGQEFRISVVQEEIPTTTIEPTTEETTIYSTEESTTTSQTTITTTVTDELTSLLTTSPASVSTFPPTSASTMSTPMSSTSPASTSLSTVLPSYSTSTTTESTTMSTTPSTSTSSDPATPSPGSGKIYTACELAEELTYLFDDIYDWDAEMNNWLCLSDHATGFNDSYFSLSASEMGLAYYGIFKLSNKWCWDVYDSSNLCGIQCNDLHGNLVGNVYCSQKIFNESQFSEWPEYEANCSTVTPGHYLQNCSEKPYFDLNAETDKVFEEYAEFEEIRCSAYGYPPPELYWDDLTKNYIMDAGDRIFVNLTKRQDLNGTWAMQLLLTFRYVLKTDERESYICNAKNIAIQGSISQKYSVRVLRKTSDPWKQPLLIGGSLGLGLAGLMLIPLGLMYRKRKKKNADLLKIYEQFKYGNPSTEYVSDGSNILENTLANLPTPEHLTYQTALNQPFSKYLEILPDRLKLHPYDILGSGAFGIVFKGVLDKLKVVAIKTVAKNADPSKLAALLSEVKIMTYVGNHTNIVALIGVQLVDLRKGVALVVLEFCARGSLEGMLHAKRRALERSSKYVGVVQHILGYIDVDSFEEPFSIRQLLTFSQQVCNAMEFLSIKRIIHGDLAARNVLVDVNMVAKISDFGLSKQIYDDNYKKYVFAAKETALPWRSLAIETLRYLKFSTESDIWAFGVFVWEVFSLADVPYTAGIQWGPEFITYLETGYRLQKPIYATQEIYELMEKCWKSKPSRRINFPQLRVALTLLLQEEYRKE